MSAWSFFLIDTEKDFDDISVQCCRIELDGADTREELHEMLSWIKGKSRKEVIEYVQNPTWARGTIPELNKNIVSWNNRNVIIPDFRNDKCIGYKYIDDFYF